MEIINNMFDLTDKEIKVYYVQSCKECGYIWESRKPNPKSCPRCRVRRYMQYVMRLGEKEEKTKEPVDKKDRV